MADCLDELDELSRFTERFISQRHALRHLDINSTTTHINTWVRDAWGGQGIYFKSSPQITLFNDLKSNVGDRFLFDLLNTFQEFLINNEVPSRLAADLSLDYIHTLHAVIQGQQIYIRKLPDSYYRDRDAVIYNEFDGHNHLDLCRKYGFTLQRLYQILRQQSPRRSSR